MGYPQRIEGLGEIRAAASSGRITITTDPTAPDGPPGVTVRVEHALLVAGVAELERVLADDLAEALAELLPAWRADAAVAPDQAAAIRDVVQTFEDALRRASERSEALQETVARLSSSDVLAARGEVSSRADAR